MWPYGKSFQKKCNIKLLYDPTVSLLDHYAKEINLKKYLKLNLIAVKKGQKETHIPMSRINKGK